MSLAESIYEKLTNEEDTRLCSDISDKACREAPSSFVIILFSNFLTKLGDAIASPKITLAWVISIVGAPAYVLGFLVPIRESGSLIPQIFIGSVIRRLAVRKWVWVVGSIVQALAIFGVALTVFFLQGKWAGWSILTLLVVFSLARGFCSVASKDVLGKTIPKTKRGQLTGWSASAAGFITVGVGVFLVYTALQSDDRFLYGSILLLAGLLWVLASGIYSQIKEYSGETGGGRNGIEAIRSLRILIIDKAFRRFVMTRALLMCSALSAPFYIALAQENLGSRNYLLGLFLASSGVASLVSAPLWGRFADKSSKWVMIVSALITSSIGIIIFIVSNVLPSIINAIWFLPIAYFFLSVAHSGVRVGRKTYIVNLATGNKRTDYVAVSNSVIGILLLMVGSIGILTPLITIAGVIALLSLMGFIGAIFGLFLPEVEN